MINTLLEHHLRTLRLPIMLGNYRGPLSDQTEPALYFPNPAALEATKRQENSVRARIFAARVLRIKTIEAFDFSLQRQLSKSDDAAVAEHPRGTERDQMLVDLRHFIDLRSHKHRASQDVAVFADGRLPETFLTLRDRHLTRNEGQANKAWMTVLLLFKEHSMEAVVAAIAEAMARHDISLLLSQEGQPPTAKTLSFQQAFIDSGRNRRVGRFAHIFQRRTHRARIMSNALLEHHLRTLRLPTMLGNYRRLLSEHTEPLPYVADLAALKAAKRQEHGVRARIIVARFSTITIDASGFSLQSQLPNADDTAVAAHPRATERDQMLLDVRHSMDLRSHKHRVSLRATVFADERLLEAFLMLRDRYLKNSEGQATKAWVTVLPLLKKYSTEAVDVAIAEAMADGTDDAATAVSLRQYGQQPTANTLSLSKHHPSIPREIVVSVDLLAYCNDELIERVS